MPKGPNGGRMLTDGDFAVEVTIFEAGQDPQFRVFPTRNGKPVDPGSVKLTMKLRRLGGAVDTFAFKPAQTFLAGQGVVEEPHSFDVEVVAVERGKRHVWTYSSPEGRTRITADAANDERSRSAHSRACHDWRGTRTIWHCPVGSHCPFGNPRAVPGPGCFGD